MGPRRYHWVLFVACLSVLLSSQSPARALPLDLDGVASPTAGILQSAEPGGSAPLPWAVLNTLAAQLSASATLADGWSSVWSHPGSFVIMGPGVESSPGVSPACSMSADRADPAFSRSLDDPRPGLPWRAALSGGSRWPIPLTPPSSAGEYELDYGLLIPTLAFRPVAVARLAQNNPLLAAIPYLGSLFRPPWASALS